MKWGGRSVKKWSYLLHVVMILGITLSDHPPLRAGEIHIVVRNDLVSVTVKDAPVIDVLQEIGRKTTPPFSVKSFTTQRVTANFENLPIKKAIAKLTKNYALIFDQQMHQLRQIFLLREGGPNTVVIDDKRGVGKVFPVPVDNMADADEYIHERHQCLEDLWHQDREGLLSAQLSFHKYIPASEVVDALKDKVVIKTLNLGWKEMSGGYSINPDHSSKEEILHDLINKHRQSLQIVLHDEKELLNNSENIEMEKSAKELLQNAKEQWAMTGQGVVMVYGAEISGSIEKVRSLLYDSRVKLIDTAVCIGEIKTLLKKEGHKGVKPIILPLKPENL